MCSWKAVRIASSPTGRTQKRVWQNLQKVPDLAEVAD
jgi:hypothetical protein